MREDRRLFLGIATIGVVDLLLPRWARANDGDPNAPSDSDEPTSSASIVEHVLELYGKKVFGVYQAEMILGSAGNRYDLLVRDEGKRYASLLRVTVNPLDGRHDQTSRFEDFGLTDICDVGFSPHSTRGRVQYNAMDIQEDNHLEDFMSRRYAHHLAVLMRVFYPGDSRGLKNSFGPIKRGPPLPFAPEGQTILA